MPKKAKSSPSRPASGLKPTGGTKLNRVSPKGVVKGHNSGGTNEAGDHQVQGASHQGSSLGKRNSG